MLKKLLKYDFKAVFKYWWIGALASFVLAMVGSVCLALLSSDRNFPPGVDVLANIGLVLVGFGFVAFSLLATILLFARFYRNFFTDEGYLTFTLPVKTSQLLHSKLIVGMVTGLATILVLVLDIAAMFCAGIPDEIFSAYFWDAPVRVFREISQALGGWQWVYLAEGILLILAYELFSLLLLYFCITMAGTVVRRARLILALGIYYGVTGMITSFIQILISFGITSMVDWLSPIPAADYQGVVALILAGILFFVGIFCALFYLLQYWMLDRKLNLS